MGQPEQSQKQPDTWFNRAWPPTPHSSPIRSTNATLSPPPPTRRLPLPNTRCTASVNASIPPSRPRPASPTASLVTSPLPTPILTRPPHLTIGGPATQSP